MSTFPCKSCVPWEHLLKDTGTENQVGTGSLKDAVEKLQQQDRYHTALALYGI
jgi:hypothetical protein